MVRYVNRPKPTINAIDVALCGVASIGAGYGAFHLWGMDAACTVGALTNTVTILGAYQRRVALHWQHLASLPSRVRRAEDVARSALAEAARKPIRVAMIDRVEPMATPNVLTFNASVKNALPDIAYALMVQRCPVSRRGLQGILSQRKASDFVKQLQDNGLADGNKLTARGESFFRGLTQHAPVNRAGSVGLHSTEYAISAEFEPVGESAQS